MPMIQQPLQPSSGIWCCPRSRFRPGLQRALGWSSSFPWFLFRSRLCGFAASALESSPVPPASSSTTEGPQTDRRQMKRGRTWRSGQEHEDVYKTHFLIFLQDQPLLLAGDDRQRKGNVCAVLMLDLVTQTAPKQTHARAHTHTHRHTHQNVISNGSLNPRLSPKYYSWMTPGPWVAPDPWVTPGRLTCASSPAPPCGSCSGCTGPGSSRSGSPGSRPSGPACGSGPACSSAAGSRSARGSPLQRHQTPDTRHQTPDTSRIT